MRRRHVLAAQQKQSFDTIYYSTKHHIQIPVLPVDDAKGCIPQNHAICLHMGITIHNSRKDSARSCHAIYRLVPKTPAPLTHPTNPFQTPQLPTLSTQNAILTKTPVTTPICLLLLHTPSSLTNHTIAPTAQKNPITFPHNISSNPPPPSTSS